MKSLLVLIAFCAIFIKFSSCNKCNESSYTPYDNLDMKKIAGRWYFITYDDGVADVSNCDYSDITYSSCKDQYSIKYHRFTKDNKEETKEGWIDIPTANVGIWNVEWGNGKQRTYTITEVDYEKYHLVRGLYDKKSYAIILIRDEKLGKKLKKKISEVIKKNHLGKDELYYGPDFTCQTPNLN